MRFCLTAFTAVVCHASYANNENMDSIAVASSSLRGDERESEGLENTRQVRSRAKPATRKLKSAWIGTNLLAPWFNDAELLLIPLQLLLASPTSRDSEAVKYMKERARLAVEQIQSATGKTGSAMLKMLLMHNKPLRRIVTAMRRLPWFDAKLVGSFDMSADADKKLILRVLEQYSILARDRDRPLVTSMPEIIRLLDIPAYHEIIGTPVETVPSAAPPGYSRAITKPGNFNEPFYRLSDDIFKCSDHLVDFSTGSELKLKPGHFLIPEMCMHFSLPSRRNPSNIPQHLVINKHLMNITIRLPEEAVLFSVGYSLNLGRVYFAILNNGVVEFIHISAEANEQGYREIDDIKVSDASVGFTGTKEGRSAVDLEIQSRLITGYTGDRLPIIDVDLPPRHLWKTGSQMVKGVKCISYKDVKAQPDDSDAAVDLLKSLQPQKPLVWRTTLVVCDATDDEILHEVCGVLGRMRLPSISSVTDPRKLELRRVAADIMWSIWDASSRLNALKQIAFKGEAFCAGDVERLYLENFPIDRQPGQDDINS